MADIPPAPPLPTEDINIKPVHKNIRENIDTLYDLNLYNKIHIVQIEHVPQTGPNCGIAAITMVTKLVRLNLSIADIFNIAKSRGYTNHGEMISVKYMADLAEDILSTWFNIEMFTDGLANNKQLVIERLYTGCLLLVPYDADKDHTPCCLGGRKAHWALVCGVMIDTDGNYCVAAMHGKSRHLAVWSLDSLCRSNDNLNMLDPSGGFLYPIPPAGLSDGLASEFLILCKRTSLFESDNVTK